MPTLPKPLKVNVSVSVKDGNEVGVQGDLNGLSLGLGLRLTWIITFIFASPAVLGTGSISMTFLNDELAFSAVSLIHLVAFCAMLFITAATDQKYLHIYTSKRVLLAMALLTSVGTSLVFLSPTAGAVGAAASVLSGISTGVGAAMLMLYWSTAFSRYDTMCIVVNTAAGVIAAFALSAIMLRLLPLAAFAVLVVILPLIELLLLWQYTPVSYAVRHVIPIFNPLPIKKTIFVKRFVPSMLCFGFAIGAVRVATAQTLIPSSDLIAFFFGLIIAGTIVLILIPSVSAMQGGRQWDTMFDILVPLISISFLFFPYLTTSPSTIVCIVALCGSLMFETLLWAFFGEIVQESRISPLFVFSVGQLSLGLGTLVGVLLAVVGSSLLSESIYGLAGGSVISLIIAMTLGLALLIRMRDIYTLVKPEEAEESPSIGILSQQLDNAMATETKSDSEPEEEEDEEATVQTPSPDSQQYPRRFKMKCEVIANRYFLSRRETEVLYFLAKGNKASYIQDKLCISKSTAKTHISHIYRKLDVHNQQELMDMVNEVSLEKEPPPQRNVEFRLINDE